MRIFTGIALCFVILSRVLPGSQDNSTCNQDDAAQLALKTMRRKGYDMNEYRYEPTDDSISYKVTFILKDTLKEGGGGVITVSKKNCRITRKVFYQ
jgi:hypothetical protein